MELKKQWVRILGSSSLDYATSISTSSDGTIYLAGITEGELDDQNSSGSRDVFIAKYNSNGIKEWTRILGSSDYDDATSITTATNGSIYLAGNTYSNLDGQLNNGDGDAFITKYNSDGTKAWTRILGSPYWDYATSITTSNDGAIYLAGNTEGYLDDQLLDSSTGVFIAKYNSDGIIEWTRLLGSSPTEGEISITTSDDGSIYLAGGTEAHLDGQENNGGYSDVFITKYNSDGTKEWTRLLGSSDYDYATSIATASDGFIYIAGNTYGNIDGQLNNENGDAFITKYNSDGSKVWTQILGSSEYDYATSITTSSNGFVYLLGNTYGDIDGQTNNSGHDNFITKFNNNGTKEWTHLLGTSTWDTAKSIATSSNVFIYVAGETYNEAEIENIANGYDAFIAKYTITSTSDHESTDIYCSSFEFDENIPANSPVADLFSSNRETNNTFTYSLVSGNGDSDNSAFSISGDKLLINNSPDYETNSSYSIRVQSKDQGGITIENEFNFSVIDINDSPSINKSLPLVTINRGSNFSYALPTNLFLDQDSTLTLSATTTTSTQLPSWLTFNATTGTFTGTPATGGNVVLYISASDGLTSASTRLELKIREVQSISSLSKPIPYQRNKDLIVPINYSTTDGSKSTGISFNIYFNSSLLSFDANTGVANKVQADLFNIGAIQADATNSDGDSSTDQFIPISIASFAANFPSTTTPSKLADLTFKAADKSIDLITGLGNTNINFTEIEAAQGYGFSSFSASLTPLSFNLDVDGDGKITALGDGLMIIRKLFGATFAGDALTNKAISPTASRDTAQIHDFIQQGIDSGLLDVDGDRRTTALGDGLMVIRRLFGTTFSGSALTDKAISPDSPHLNGSIYNQMTTGEKISIADLIGGNIDALRLSPGSI